MKNKKNNKIKKIGIDARLYGPFAKGLGRYTQEVVDNIIKIDKHNKYIIFLGKNNFDELVLDDDLRNVKKVLVDIKWYSLKEQLLFPFYIWRERLDLIHFMHFNVPIFCPVKFVVTIHDLILTKFKTIRATTRHPLIYNLKYFFYRLIIKRALRGSRKIITVSNFTKNDIIDQFKVKPEKIKVIYGGISNLAKGRDSLFVNKLDNDEVLSDYLISSRFLLYVGNAYPHKNLEFLIKSFLIFSKSNKNLKLVLVGKEDYFYKNLKSYFNSLISENNKFDPSSVIFTGYVPDNKLEILYKRALFYVFPSLYEGFGLPPLEALFNFCPVLSSSAASMPEILGDGALYFNPRDENDFLEKMNDIINSEDLRDSIVKKGRALTKNYNWWECAFKVRQVFLDQLK